MRRQTLTVCLAALALGLALTPSPTVAANLLLNADNGISERVFASNSRAGSDDIIFIWQRELPLGPSGFAVTGLCNRQDEFLEFVGNHRVIFKNVSLTGVDSGNEILLSRVKRRLRDGIQNDFAIWDVTEEVSSLLAEDELVLVQGRITVRKNVAANNLLTCGLAAIEADLTGLESNSTSERLQRFRQMAPRAISVLRRP